MAFDSDSEDDDAVEDQQTSMQNGTHSEYSANANNTATSSAPADLAQQTAELREMVAHWKSRAEASARLISELTNERVSQHDDSDTQDNDTYYFHSYSHISIHETMLRDTVRTGQ